MLLTSCGAIGLSGSSTGSMVGGTLGSILGGQVNSGYGSAIGGVVGAMAGAAIGNAMEKKAMSQQYSPSTGSSFASTRAAAEVNASTVKLENFHFVDANNNRAINSNEECKVLFDVVNTGSRAVQNVTPQLVLAQKASGINIGGATTIASIPARGKVTYSVPVVAGKVKNGEAVFQAYAVEANGAESTVIEFSLPTQK